MRPHHARRAAARAFLAVGRVAELLGTSERTVRRWIDGKKLKSHQFGGASRIASADLIVFIERARQAGAPLPARNPLEDTFYTVEAIAEILNVCVRHRAP